MIETRWRPITVFVNGSEPDALVPPEFTIGMGGLIEIRGRCAPGIEGHPCVRLPEDARPEETFVSADWWGFEYENFRSVRVDPDGYVTIIEITKQQLLDSYLASLA